MEIGRPHVGEMLEQAKLALDQIFGAHGYTIAETGKYSALLKTEFADFEFTDDPRDFVAASAVNEPGNDVIESPIDIWMKFLGEETPLQIRSLSEAVGE
jgi:hypothetical protein